jgi:hypothetical protein
VYLPPLLAVENAAYGSSHKLWKMLLMVPHTSYVDSNSSKLLYCVDWLPIRGSPSISTDCTCPALLLIMNATVLKADLCSSLEVRLEFFPSPLQSGHLCSIILLRKPTNKHYVK